MIDQLLKAIVSEKSRVTLQLGILIAIISCAFYAGGYAKELIITQEKAFAEQKKIAIAIQELVDQSKDYWTYQMHREYNERLQLSDGTLVKPSLPEIREKFSN